MIKVLNASEVIAVTLTVPFRVQPVTSLLDADQAQELAEQLLVAAANSRRISAARNQPDLFVVADLLAGRV